MKLLSDAIDGRQLNESKKKRSIALAQMSRGLTDVEKVAARLVELVDQYKFDEDSIVHVLAGGARLSIALLPLKGHRPHRTCTETGSATLHMRLADRFPFEAGRRPALRESCEPSDRAMPSLIRIL